MKATRTAPDGAPSLVLSLLTDSMCRSWASRSSLRSCSVFGSFGTPMMTPTTAFGGILVWMLTGLDGWMGRAVCRSSFLCCWALVQPINHLPLAICRMEWTAPTTFFRSWACHQEPSLEKLTGASVGLMTTRNSASSGLSAGMGLYCVMVAAVVSFRGQLVFTTPAYVVLACLFFDEIWAPSRDSLLAFSSWGDCFEF